MPSKTVTASHVTQGTVEYESAVPEVTDEGLDLWEATEHFMNNDQWKVINTCVFDGSLYFLCKFYSEIKNPLPCCQGLTFTAL